MSSVLPGAFSMICDRYLPSPSWVMPRATVTPVAGTSQKRVVQFGFVWIASESEFTPKTIQTRDSRANLVYAAKIAVENDGRLKIGLYGEVRLRN